MLGTLGALLTMVAARFFHSMSMDALFITHHGILIVRGIDVSEFV
jgi:hypothetical protein